VLAYEIRERVTCIDESDGRWCEVDPAVWQAIDPAGHQWLTFMRPDELLVARKLREVSIRLEQIARTIQRGISPYEPLRRLPGPGYEKCLDGELRRYTYEFSGESCVAYHPDIAEYKDRELFEGSRTIARQLISRQFRIQAVATDAFFVVNQSHQVIHPSAPLTHHQITGIVNSAALSFWHVRRSALARRDDFPKIVLEDTKGFPIPKLLLSDASIAEELHTVAADVAALDIETRKLASSARHALTERCAVADLSEWMGYTQLDDLDYLGWEGRFPAWQPDERSAEEGRCYPNGVSPPLEGEGPGAIPWELIARVYPSYPLPGIDAAGWELAAWDDLCELLRKNKTKIGNPRVRADLTGSGPVAHPTGALRQLRETFLDHHRRIRANRARAAELDFLIDRIVFRLFDLTPDEQRLILSRVGPGRPLPPRRGGKRKKAKEGGAGGPRLFDLD
jgi:hypothetical protein